MATWRDRVLAIRCYRSRAYLITAGENTPLGTDTFSRRAGTRALPDYTPQRRWQPRSDHQSFTIRTPERLVAWLYNQSILTAMPIEIRFPPPAHVADPRSRVWLAESICIFKTRRRLRYGESDKRYNDRSRAIRCETPWSVAR